MKMAIVTFLLIILSLVGIPSSATGKVIASDTVWKDEVLISEDILIPEGITLTILPGTVINISPSEGTKTDPEYISSLTEIIVRGTLKAEGTDDAQILFQSIEKLSRGWAGIIIDGGVAYLNSCRIQNAETGINIINGALTIENSILRENRYGLVAQGRKAKVVIKDTRVTENDYGIFSLSGAKVESENIIVKGNRKKDSYEFRVAGDTSSLTLPPRGGGMGGGDYEAERRDVSRRYRDEVLLGNTIWQGRIEIDGLIRVPEGSRLIIMPGTIVEFKKKDTNNDGIGENGFLIQGVIIAKGTTENPIIFRSAEKQKRMGDWDAINIMNSDGAQNLIEYCQIEDAYRGLHFHFSNVAVSESVLRNNYRGIQFQESSVNIKGNYFYRNKSGIQARDSEIIFTNNHLVNNYSGANFFRVSLIAKGNEILNNINEGLKVREGIPTVEKNLIACNRHGLMVSDSLFGSFSRNVISNNLESGISLKGTDNIDINGNFIQGNGFNGISIQDSSAVIKGNHISENGERGIGIISFDGIIAENNIVKNGLYALGIDGITDISAPMNWWEGSDVEKIIYDKNDEPSRGKVEYKPVSEKPFLFPWPLDTISTDTTWYGNIHIQRTVTVPSGITLKIAPNTKVMFSKETGLKITNGKILAIGERDKRIVFTKSPSAPLFQRGVWGNSGGFEDSRWDEIFLEHASDSMFSNCDFEYATWAIHSHFTNLKVESCSFKNNYGGIRFRSGPVEIKNSVFEGNSIGVRAYRGSAVIRENVIKKNEIGIFVREKGGGLTIKRNNLFGNAEYNIRIGDFNDEDVNAAENYWGDKEPANTIFDDRKEPGIGKVHYEPYAKEPFKIENARQNEKNAMPNK
jgi:parallel beta-helix repeat protein